MTLTLACCLGKIQLFDYAFLTIFWKYFFLRTIFCFTHSLLPLHFAFFYFCFVFCFCVCVCSLTSCPVSVLLDLSSRFPVSFPPSGGGGCAANEFRCQDGTVCIRDSQRCDDIQDCPDSSDENDCPGEPNHISGLDSIILFFFLMHPLNQRRQKNEPIQ